MLRSSALICHVRNSTASSPISPNISPKGEHVCNERGEPSRWLVVTDEPGWAWEITPVEVVHPDFRKIIHPFRGIWGIFFIFKFINEKPKDTNMQPVGLGTNWTSTSFQGDFWASWVQILVFSQVRTVTCCDLPVSICSIDSSEIIRNVPEILSFNQLLLKLDWFICN